MATMTTVEAGPDVASTTIEKVSIIISKGSLDGIYTGLIMANGARAEGIEANLFFTFFGLDAIHRARHEHICKASVDLFGLERGDFTEQVQDTITVGEFYEKAAGGQILFT
mgnify:CR=1 FL=1